MLKTIKLVKLNTICVLSLTFSLSMVPGILSAHMIGAQNIYINAVIKYKQQYFVIITSQRLKLIDLCNSSPKHHTFIPARLRVYKKHLRKQSMLCLKHRAQAPILFFQPIESRERRHRGRQNLGSRWGLHPLARLSSLALFVCLSSPLSSPAPSFRPYATFPGLMPERPHLLRLRHCRCIMGFPLSLMMVGRTPWDLTARPRRSIRHHWTTERHI